MSKLPEFTIFNILESISKMSPKQRLIAKNFYLWMLSIKKGKMKGLWMRVLYIAQQSDCCADTVIRFLKEFKDLIKTIRRRGRTNSYAPSKDFLIAMQFMDKEKMLNKSHRQVKSWLIGMMRAELQSSYENVEICDPSCSNLRPNPSSYPFIKVHSADKPIGNFLIDELPLDYWQKKRLICFSQAVLVSAVEDYNWYRQRKVVTNPYGLILSRALSHREKYVRA